jgi:hypothetical protein
MSAAIGYLRVSTREQGRSGLGLAAQRFEIEAFGAIVTCTAGWLAPTAVCRLPDVFGPRLICAWREHANCG